MIRTITTVTFKLPYEVRDHKYMDILHTNTFDK